MYWFLCVILPYSANISALAELIHALIRVSGPRNPLWSTAKAEIAPQRRPESSIHNVTVRHEGPFQLRISWLILTLFSRGFVFLDRLPGLNLKSFRRSGLKSWFPIRAPSRLQEERPVKSWISRLIPTLSSRGYVFPDRADTLDWRQSLVGLFCGVIFFDRVCLAEVQVFPEIIIILKTFSKTRRFLGACAAGCRSTDSIIPTRMISPLMFPMGCLCMIVYAKLDCPGSKPGGCALAQRESNSPDLHSRRFNGRDNAICWTWPEHFRCFTHISISKVWTSWKCHFQNFHNYGERFSDLRINLKSIEEISKFKF